METDANIPKTCFGLTQQAETNLIHFNFIAICFYNFFSLDVHQVEREYLSSKLESSS